MPQFNVRRISDPVHDTIGLSDAEVAVIGTKAFQRLRHVKQLGLANLVFPGADYSRLSHCVGVCHVTGRIIAALQANGQGTEFTVKEIQAYRMAGLLHDVGHYPFSHAMEEAIQNFYSGQLLGTGPAETFLNHEAVGKNVLELDPEISAVMRRVGIDPVEISSIFNRAQPNKLTNLISSDLDADRIDYLLRTAHFSGLPYGSVDLEYLLTQIRLDDQGRICLTRKALCAADHFLLSRYFDYQQVSYHKTVAALEWLLKDVLGAMLAEGRLDCSEREIKAAIGDGRWSAFDDTHIWGAMRSFAASGSSVAHKKAQALLARETPKMIGHYEAVDSLSRKADFTQRRRHLGTLVEKAASSLGIDPAYFHVWHKSGIALTKVGSRIPVGAVLDGAGSKEKDKYEQSVRILGDDGKTSTDLMSERQSLMNLLSDNGLFALRLYVLMPEGRSDDRAKIAGIVGEAFAN